MCIKHDVGEFTEQSSKVGRNFYAPMLSPRENEKNIETGFPLVPLKSTRNRKLVDENIREILRNVSANRFLNIPRIFIFQK